jgi:DNA-directed RNA polymerase subunit RPC12/RpoP
MQEVRCTKCGKLLGKIRQKQTKDITLNVGNGEITETDSRNNEPNFWDFEFEIKCPRCGELNTK